MGSVQANMRLIRYYNRRVPILLSSYHVPLSTSSWRCLVDKDGKNGPLLFPPFHQEMLSQAWIIPGQALGRIKVILAEGTCRGVPGSGPFQRTRNIVAFSFQHTPLRKSYLDILPKPSG